jgi:hypothetical protein
LPLLPSTHSRFISSFLHSLPYQAKEAAAQRKAAATHGKRRDALMQLFQDETAQDRAVMVSAAMGSGSLIVFLLMCTDDVTAGVVQRIRATRTPDDEVGTCDPSLACEVLKLPVLGARSILHFAGDLFKPPLCDSR